MEHLIRTIVRDAARLAVDADTLNDESDLYEAGMTSQASVNVMLALEEEFDVEFPDNMLRRSVFSSFANIRDALTQLTHNRAAEDGLTRNHGKAGADKWAELV